jgi:hypothetical protein
MLLYGHSKCEWDHISLYSFGLILNRPKKHDLYLSFMERIGSTQVKVRATYLMDFRAKLRRADLRGRPIQGTHQLLERVTPIRKTGEVGPPHSTVEDSGVTNEDNKVSIQDIDGLVLQNLDNALHTLLRLSSLCLGYPIRASQTSFASSATSAAVFLTSSQICFKQAPETY